MPKFDLNKKSVFLISFFSAFIVRVVFVLQWNDTPYGSVPLLDARAYDDWAQAIAAGDLLRDKAFYQSPLYPYFLGLVYNIFGHQLSLAGLLNAIFGALTAGILSLITFTYFASGAAIIAGLLTAFYRPLVFYTAPVMKESLSLLLLSLFLFFALRALKQKKTRDFFISGMFLGLCALTRGNILFLVPVLVLFSFYQRQKGWLKNSVVFTSATVLFILPATLHNAIVSRDFVPVNYADGFNFYIGHSPVANGTNAYPPEVSTDPVQEELNVTWIAEKETGRDLAPSEVSAFWRARAVKTIAHNPWREIVLLKNKLEAFLSNYQAFDNYDVNFIRQNFGTIVNWPLTDFWLLLPLAVFGVVAAWCKQKDFIVILLACATLYSVSVLLFYVTDRYRLPVIIFLFPLAGIGMSCLWKLIRSYNYGQIVKPSAAAFVALIVALHTPATAVDLTAFNWGTLSTIYSDLEQDEKTLEAFNRAVAISPQQAGAQTFIRASFAAENLGDHKEAEKLLKLAMDYYPQDGIVHYNHGRLKAAHGNLEGALKDFQRATELSPTYILNYFALAKVYNQLGDLKGAREVIDRGLAIDPGSSLLLELKADFKRTH